MLIQNLGKCLIFLDMGFSQLLLGTLLCVMIKRKCLLREVFIGNIELLYLNFKLRSLKIRLVGMCS